MDSQVVPTEKQEIFNTAYEKYVLEGQVQEFIEYYAYVQNIFKIEDLLLKPTEVYAGSRGEGFQRDVLRLYIDLRFMTEGYTNKVLALNQVEIYGVYRALKDLYKKAESVYIDKNSKDIITQLRKNIDRLDESAEALYKQYPPFAKYEFMTKDQLTVYTNQRKDKFDIVPQVGFDYAKEEQRVMTLVANRDNELKLMRAKVAETQDLIDSAQSQIDMNQEILPRLTHSIDIDKQRVADLEKSVSELETLQATNNTEKLKVVEEVNKIRIQELDNLRKESEQRQSDTEQHIKELKEQSYRSLKRITDLQDQAKANMTYHLIFVLDESGSMSSSNFNNVINCVKKLINAVKDPSGQRKDQQTIITFNDNSKIRVAGQTPLTDKIDISQRRGGTNFYKAFQGVKDVMPLTRAYAQPIVIFLTDGEAPVDQARSILEEIYNDTFKKGFPMWFFTIGFGPDFREQDLKVLARAGNGGELQRTIIDENVYMMSPCESIDAVEKTFYMIGNLCKNLVDLEAIRLNIEQRIKSLEDQLVEAQIKSARDLKDMQDSINSALNNELLKKKEGYEEQNKYINEQITNFKDDMSDLEDQIKDKLVEKKALNDEITQNQNLIASATQNLQDQKKYLADFEASVNKQKEMLNNQRDQLIQNGYVDVTMKRLSENNEGLFDYFEFFSRITKFNTLLTSSIFNISKYTNEIIDEIEATEKLVDSEELFEHSILSYMVLNDLLSSMPEKLTDAHFQIFVQYYVKFHEGEPNYDIIQKFYTPPNFTKYELRSEDYTDEKLITEENKKYRKDKINPYVADNYQPKSPLPPITHRGSSLSQKIDNLEDDLEKEKSQNFNGLDPKRREAQYLIEINKLSIQKKEIELEKLSRQSEIDNMEKSIQRHYNKIEDLTPLLVEPEQIKLEQSIAQTFEKMRQDIHREYKTIASKREKDEMASQVKLMAVTLLPILAKFEAITRV